ncbi:endolytic transglycosylase MltG [Syntrophorhabdus aromaticivorans]|uniref:endolytic transglycosylase MltG n=1 Tax=Syntrophorhabdus aromaticivorans TaxID=328301 RepID=UPI00042A5883|nr:endolytic transglycosylase MltG [Syntrophorhabdus aromaticivorans]
MLTRQNRNTILIAVAIFVVTQTFIFASIPNNTDRDSVAILVKSGTGLWEIADKLKKNGLIRYPSLFVLCSLAYRGRLLAGEYELRKDMSIIEIVAKMGRGERNIYVLKILEGHNLYNIAEMAEKSGIMGSDEFLRLARDPGFLKRLGIKADSLEGYLPPDTYYYSREISTDHFIERIVKKTFKNFAKEDIKRGMENLKFDTHKTLILASIIEKEARLKEEKPVISAVFHNRLKQGMSLDADPTVIYGTGNFNGPITRSDLSTPTPYNTYKFPGLPKGPICNPDRNSIMAALYPASVDYLYFVSKNDGTHVFSKDMNDHNRYVAMYQRAKNAKKQ